MTVHSDTKAPEIRPTSERARGAADTEVAAQSDKKALETKPASEHVKSKGSPEQTQALASAGRSLQKATTVNDDNAIVRQAAAFRVKYKKPTKIRIPVIQVG